MEDIRALLKRYAEETDQVLNNLLDLSANSISPTLLDAMKYTLFSGGKRLRPILTRLTTEMVGGDRESALKAGAAIELIHTYSLIHDDLPSMDNDDYRRGKLTNHKVFSPGIAILAGDGLLTYAFNVLAGLDLAPEKVVRLVSLISDGAGYRGMVGGQVLDLEAEGEEISLEKLQQIHLAKTGALFHCSILAGAYCGDPTAEEIKALEDFALHLGLTFQIVDDVLDVIGDEKQLGKKVGSDQELNKSTYPRLLGLDGAKAEAEKNADLAKKALQVFGERAETLKELTDFILIRQS